MDTKYGEEWPVCDRLEREEIINKIINIVSDKYIDGFWEWLKEQETADYEIIIKHQELMENSCQNETIEDFKRRARQWFNALKRGLQKYSKNIL